MNDDLPVGIEHLRRIAFDLSVVRDRVNDVEAAQRSRLIPPRGTQGQTVGFDSSGNPTLVSPLYCHAYATASTVVNVTPANTWVSVPMANETADIGSLHSTSSNTERINLLRAGVWEIGFKHLWLASSGYVNGRVQSRVLKNGTTAVDYDQVDVFSGGKDQQPFTQGTTMVSSDGDDYVETQALYDNGTTSIVGASGVPGFTYFWALYIGLAA